MFTVTIKSEEHCTSTCVTSTQAQIYTPTPLGNHDFRS